MSSIGLDDIKSNRIPYCVHCGIPITKYNDSGWESFVGDGTITQPQCKDCEVHYKFTAQEVQDLFDGKPVRQVSGRHH